MPTSVQIVADSRRQPGPVHRENIERNAAQERGTNGDLRPQFEKVAELYAALVAAGLSVAPAGQVAFANAAALKGYFAAYRQYRPVMSRRTVLQDGSGVLGEGPGGRQTFFALADHGDRHACRVYPQ
jgi:hypothetical protein